MASYMVLMHHHRTVRDLTRCIFLCSNQYSTLQETHNDSIRLSGKSTLNCDLVACTVNKGIVPGVALCCKETRTGNEEMAANVVVPGFFF